METPKIIALIPARMGSSRFPGKPLTMINGIPMIGHVYKQVSKNAMLTLTAVATCDQEIVDYIQSIGGQAIFTGNHHVRASDRCAEALQLIERAEGRRFDIVVMVQGDEPMVDPEMISEAVGPMLDDPNVQVVNLMGTIQTLTEFTDPNCIKVVCDIENNAIFFSREPIPTQDKTPNISMRKQVCIIPFRRDFLLEYTDMEPTPLEIIESIDMLRVIERGLKVRMVPTMFQTKSVDTPEDLEIVSNLMSES